VTEGKRPGVNRAGAVSPEKRTLKVRKKGKRRFRSRINGCLTTSREDWRGRTC